MLTNNKKGQLSIETMILYGLIALVALAAVAALIYFDVLNLGTYLPDTCDIGGTGDLQCEEIKVSSSGTIELGVRNVGQKAIGELEICVGDDVYGLDVGSDCDVVIAEGDEALAPGEIIPVSITGLDSLNEKSGQTFDGELVTIYKFVNGAIDQEASGTLRAKIS